MIPNIFQYVYLTHDGNTHPMYQSFHLIHYLCIKSAIEVNQPEAVNFYCNQEPKGEWWKEIRDSLNVVMIEPPTEIFGKPITELAHMSDVIRLQVLIEEGGIYTDMDTICIKPYSDLLNNSFVMGEQGIDGDEGLCPAVILSEPNSKFGSSWLAGFKNSFLGGAPGSDGWCTHSVYYPWRLARVIPDAIHIEPFTSFFYPSYHQEQLKQMFEKMVDLPHAYSHHLWETCSMEWIENITVDEIRNNDTTFNLIARDLL